MACAWLAKQSERHCQLLQWLWLRWASPCLLLAAALWRAGTGVGALYCLAALADLASPCQRHRRPLAALWALTLLSSTVLCVACTVNPALLLEAAPTLHHLGLGSWSLQNMSVAVCGGLPGLVPDALALLTGLLDWAVPLPPEGAAGPTADLGLLVAQLVALSLCSALSSNLFALLYQLAVAGLALILIQQAPQAQGLGSPCTEAAEMPSSGVEATATQQKTGVVGLLLKVWRLVVACTAILHALALVFGSLGPLPAPVPQLLGLGTSKWQCLAAWSLASVLLHCQAAPSCTNTQVAAPGPSSHCLLPEQTDLSSSAPTPAASRLLHCQAAPPSTNTQEAASSSVHCLLPEPTSGTKSSSAPTPCFPAAASRLFTTAFLQVPALLLWPCLSPSLATLPLLLVALVLLAAPFRRVPLWLLRATLLYELLYAAALSAGSLTGALGLQSWGLELKESDVVAQLVAALALVLAIRQRGSRPTELPGRCPLLGPATRQWLVASARPLTVALVLVLALAAEPGRSVIGLALVVWLLVLAAAGSQAGYQVAGWDGLRSHRLVWAVLLLLSSAAAVFLFLLTVVAEPDFSMWQVHRPECWVTAAAPYLLIACLASVQVKEISRGTLQPVALVTGTSTLAWLFWFGGIFLQMGLMFSLVLIQPVSLDSFLVLLLFVGVVAIEQLNPSSPWRTGLLAATGALSGALMFFRYILLIAASHLEEFQQKLLGRALHPLLKELLALKASDQDAGKVALLGVLLFYSLALRRLLHFGALACLQYARLARVRRNPKLLQIFVEVAGWSTSILLCSSYFLMLSSGASMAVLQLLLVAWLVWAQHWQYAGAMVSVSAAALLLLEYLCRFEAVPLQPRQKHFWGLEWGWDVINQVALLLLGIFHRTALRAAQHFSGVGGLETRPEAAAGGWRMEVLAFSGHIGAFLLMLCGLLVSSVWSVVFVAVVAAFCLSGDAAERLAPSRANKWLRLYCVILAVALSWWLAFQDLVLSSNILGRPVDSYLSSSFVCRPWGSDELRSTMCTDGGCWSQQELCGRSWAAWLGVAEKTGGQRHLAFVALFCLSLLRRFGKFELDKLRLARSKTGLALESPEPVLERAGPYAAYCTTATGLWLSIILGFQLQPRTSLISAGYLLLLAWHVLVGQTVKVAVELPEKAFQRRFQALRLIRIFNVCVCIWSVAWQCPSAPCPFILALPGSQEQCLGTQLVSAGQCYALEMQTGEVRGCPDNGWSIFLQSVGAWKVQEGLGFHLGRVWHFMIFAFGTAQAVVSTLFAGELTEQLAAQGRLQRERETFYKQHLTLRRGQELARMETRHRLLLVKLQGLVTHLNQLRALWANQRPGWTEEEELARQHEVRVLDLCLESGAGQKEVSALLRSFEEGVLEGLCEPTTDTLALPAVRKCINQSVAELLSQCSLRQLLLITPQEEADRQRELLEHAREVVLSASASFTAARSWTSYQAGDAHQDAESPHVLSQASEESSSSSQKLRSALQRCLGQLVNDFLFVQPGSSTVQSHRHNDSLLVLALKALASQTLPLLFVASIAQFLWNACVTSSVAISVVLLSLMTFPHADARCWKALQFYILALISLKTLYQLPFFGDWEKGSTLFSAIFGIVRVRHGGGASLFGVLWADIVVWVALLAHWHATQRSGHLASPESICKDMEQQELEEDAVDEERPETGSSEPQKAPSSLEQEADALPVTRWARLRSAALRLGQACVGASGLRKPAMDLYTPRFVLSTVCFGMVLLFSDCFVGSNDSFMQAVTSNSFSDQQVILVILFLALLLENRAEYIWYTQYQWILERESALGKRGSRVRRGSAVGSSLSGSKTSQSLAEELGMTDAEILVRLVVPLLQRALLLAQLVAVHLVFTLQRAKELRARHTTGAAISNSAGAVLAQTVFYCCYVAYLGLTSLQLRYDIHVVRGGLGLTHNMSFLSNLALNVYSVMPFVEEMRVLTDWTVTKTSLDFFMWMKLEDANQSLYRTARDMLLRRDLPPAAPRPFSEKALQGGLLLALLSALIVGPIAFFSSLNPSLQNTPLTSAKLTVDLVARTEAIGTRSMPLYEAPQQGMRQLSPEEVLKERIKQRGSTVTHVDFPPFAEQPWPLTEWSKGQWAQILGEEKVDASIRFTYTFVQNVSMGEMARTSQASVALDAKQTQMLKELFNSSVMHPVLLQLYSRPPEQVIVGVSSNEGAIPGNLSLALEDPQVFSNVTGGLTWGLTAGNRSMGLNFTVIAAKEAPTILAGWSVVGLYVGAVYLVGKLLRSAFQGASKRIIYEELPDTALLQDLCNGIYIARIQGLLKAEYDLYYQLVHLFRSPELLLDVCGFSVQGLGPQKPFMGRSCSARRREDQAGPVIAGGDQPQRGPPGFIPIEMPELEEEELDQEMLERSALARSSGPLRRRGLLHL